MASTGPIDLLPVLRACCHPQDNVIDVGANIGVTAVLSGLLVNPGRVIAIEPVPETFGHLQDNVNRSGLPNVDCVMAAAAAEKGEVTLVAHTGWNCTAFVGFEGSSDRYESYEEYAVQALTLDSIVADQDLHDINFIKIDVEGYELDVLRGAEMTLADSRPIVFLEVNHYCLNVLRRTSIVDFIEDILDRFPFVFAIDTSFEFLDLKDVSTHDTFYQEHVVRERFPNLLCGFEPSLVATVEALWKDDRATSSDGSAAGPAPLGHEAD